MSKKILAVISSAIIGLGLILGIVEQATKGQTLPEWAALTIVLIGALVRFWKDLADLNKNNIPDIFEGDIIAEATKAGAEAGAEAGREASGDVVREAGKAAASVGVDAAKDAGSVDR